MSCRQSGFTLVELLIALSLSALLITLTYGSVVLGQRVASTLNDAVVRSEVMHIGWQFINDAITRAKVIRNPANRDDRTSFVGNADGFSLIADLPGYVGAGGLTLVTLRVDEQQNRRRLVLSQTRYPIVDDDDAEAVDAAAELVDDLASIRISYLGKVDDDGEPSWHEQWGGQRALPSLVKVEIQPAAGPQWPLLIARPLSGAVAISEPEAGDDDGNTGLEEQRDEPAAANRRREHES